MSPFRGTAADPASGRGCPASGRPSLGVSSLDLPAAAFAVAGLSSGADHPNGPGLAA